MTNYIQKLYKLAGIEETPQETISQGKFPMRVNYLGCPPFTAEKQLELIKLISSEFTVRINSNKDSTFIMLMQSAKTFLWASDDKFEQALAKLVCELWEYLKKEAKEEIKRMLE